MPGFEPRSATKPHYFFNHKITSYNSNTVLLEFLYLINKFQVNDKSKIALMSS